MFIAALSGIARYLDFKLVPYCSVVLAGISKCINLVTNEAHFDQIHNYRTY